MFFKMSRKIFFLKKRMQAYQVVRLASFQNNEKWLTEDERKNEAKNKMM